MTSTANPATPTESLVWVLTALMGAVARPGRSPLLAIWRMVIHRRINRVRNEVAELFRRIAAGTLLPFRSRKAAVSRKPMDEAQRRIIAERAKALEGMPRRVAWLLPLAHHDVAGHASQLSHLLEHDEEIRRLLAEWPQIGRALRPLCRMLGIDPALVGLSRAERKKRPETAGAGMGRRRRGGKVMGRSSGTHPTVETNSDDAAWKEPSRAVIVKAINTRRWPSIEQQARPEKYRWTPVDRPEKGERNENPD
jgi:hypothetical protein